MKHVSLHLVPALLLFSFLTVTAGCVQSATEAVESTSSGGPAAGPPPPPPALIRVATIRENQVAPEFRAMGNVKPRHVSIVASGADGIVEAFNVEVGDFVDAQTLLSQLRTESTDRDLAEQQAILEERKAELEEIRVPRKEDEDEARARSKSAEVIYANAVRRLEEIRALSKRGAANLTEVKDAQDAVDSAEQNRLAAMAVLQKVSSPRAETVEQAKARVEAQAQHVSFLEAEREKRFTKAPFAGFVVEEHTNVGQWLSKGSPVVTLATLDKVDVEVQIDQQYIDQIAPELEVTLSIYGTGSRDGLASLWTGKVVSVVPRSRWQEGSRSFPVIIRIDNKFDESTTPKTPFLREGMMAEATFRGQAVEAVLVPKDSMVRTSRGTFVFVVNPAVDGQPLSVRQVMVEPGLSSDTWIQVTGENLNAGMQVVTEGAERLRAFQTVQIKEKERIENRE